MKRVLIFSTAYFPHVGGAEVAVREIAKRLTGEYAFDLICAKYEKNLPRVEQMEEATVYRVGFGIRPIDKILSPFLGAILALQLKGKNHYDVFWAMMATYGSGGAYIANMLHFWTPVPIVLTLQEGDPPEYIRSKHFGMVALSWRLALSQSSSLSVISNYLGELAREFGYKGEYTLVPNGVDSEKFNHVTEVEIDAAKKRLGKKEGEAYLVTTSRLVHKNACDDVIRALQFLPKEVQFVVCGVGKDEEFLRTLAKELSVAERVKFLGLVGHTDIPALLQASDIFIRPSRSEGMGNSFIEAMAAGLPVIATQEGGIADFLFDAKRNPEKKTTGWAVDKNTPTQIAEAVKDIIANPDTVRSVVVTARALAVQKYDWNLIAEDMKNLFDRTLIKR